MNQWNENGSELKSLNLCNWIFNQISKKFNYSNLSYFNVFMVLININFNYKCLYNSVEYTIKTYNNNIKQINVKCTIFD